jgi:type II secretory pathway component GspD/PulD (secretin)
MKTTQTLFIVALLTAGNMRAAAQTNEVVLPVPIEAAAAASPSPVPELANSDQSTPPASTAVSTNGLRLNFSNVPLEMVLQYLSDAAGFHIVVETPVRGNVTVISSHSMTKEEAVELLNSVLNKSGAAAIRNDQFLTIVDRSEAKTRDIQVNVYNDDPSSIPKTAEIVTQIIPVRFVEAKQLVSDLSLFVSTHATIVANEAGNSILITDTQANIRHLAEIIKAIDSSAEASTEIKVYHLKHASPNDVATLISGVFPGQSGTGNTQTPVRFGGGGRGGGGGGGGPGGFIARMMAGSGAAGNSAQNDRIRKQTQVVAVADLRTSSVVVTAQKDLISQIDQMMEQLDVPSERDQQVTVFHVENGDPEQMVQVLQNTFGASGGGTSRGTTSSSTSALSQRAKQNAQQMGNSSSTSSTLGGGRTGGNTGRGVQF